MLSPISLTVNVVWYCGNWLGEPRWRIAEECEPDECATEFVTEENLQDYLDGVCVATCPSCGAQLIQGYDALGEAEEILAND